MKIEIELHNSKVVPQQLMFMKNWLEMMFVHSIYAEWIKSIDISKEEMKH